MSIHKFRVYETVSRPGVDKSSEQDFIKVILTKDQRAERIKQSDIEVQIHTITGGKNYGQVGNFGDGTVR